MAAIAVAGVGMMMCISSSVAAVMMGGEEKEDPVKTATAAQKAKTDAVTAKAKADALAADPDATPADVAAAQLEADNAQAAADAAAADAAAADAAAAASLTVGTPVQCTTNDVGSGVNSAVYRVEAGKKLRHYPNPPIATSWDADWGTTYKKIDCIGFTQGPTMEHNVTVGTPVQCTANDVGSGANSAVYRVEAGKKLRHYPNPTIATSWDADWGTTYKKIDCIGFTQGPAMAHK